MRKHLFLIIAFTFFIGYFLCEGQPDIAARKTGTLSTSSSSGSAASGTSIYDNASINTTGLNMLNSTTAIFCLNNSTMILGVALTWTNPGWPQARGYWYYEDHVSEPLESFYLNNGSYIYDSVIINKPGVYHYACQAGTVGILITSSIPFDSIPNKTIFCPNGSVTLTAPAGSFSDYQWYNDNDLIPGEKSNSYLATKSGNYHVQLTNLNNGCVLNIGKVNVTVYSPPSQLTITGNGSPNSSLTLDNNTGDLNPESITWYRDDVPIKNFNDKGIVVAGGNGAGSELNQLSNPYGIFVDSMKNIYVADNSNARIMKWNNGSNIGEKIISSEQGFYDNPTDVLLDSPVIYISGGQNVYRSFLPFDYVESIYNAPSNGGFDAWGLSVNSNHELYFDGSDYGYNENDPSNIQYYYNQAVIYKFLGASYYAVAGVNSPNGIYVDSLDNVYVAENLTDSLTNFYGRIVRWAPGATTGELITGVGHGNAPNQISFVAGVTFDKKGNMYVTDPVNNRVQLWKPGADHGITIASGFTPWGIKVDDSDNVYVADQTNNQVLKFPSLLYNKIKADTIGVYKAVVTYPGGCTVTSNDFTVSIPILNFMGQLKNGDALLSWQTASEHNMSYFNIQRSLDGVNFITLGKVMVTGNTSSLYNYSYTDTNVASLNANKIYYRLEETDIFGASVQSNMISIVILNSVSNFTISPNPVRNLLKVQLNNIHGNTNVSVIDITGRKLNSQQINASGNDVLNFNTDNLSRGLYIMWVINKGQNKCLKFIKE